MFWRVSIIIFFALVNVTLLYRMIWGPTGLIEYHNLKRQHSDLQRQIEELDARNLNLSQEIRLLQTDNQFLEKMIRQRLHYVYDNELIYLFDDANTNSRGAAKDVRKN